MLLTVVKGEANGVIAMWRGLEVDRIDVKFGPTPFSVPQLARGVRLSLPGKAQREYRCRLKC